MYKYNIDFKTKKYEIANANFRDHAGGNKQLKEMMPELLVYGGDERIDCLTKKVGHDTQLSIGSLGVKCLFTPCHTTGHICYYVTSKTESGEESKAVFTGKLEARSDMIHWVPNNGF